MWPSFLALNALASSLKYWIRSSGLSVSKRIFELPNFLTDFSTLTPDSIRYPPNASIPKGLVNTPKLKEKISDDNAALTPKLENFSQMYQQMAANLLNISLDKLIFNLFLNFSFFFIYSFFLIFF